MKYSVSNWIYGNEPLELTLARLARFGYDGVELEGEPGKYNVDEVNNLLRKYNLKVFSIAGIYPWPTDERDLANPDPEVRRKAIEYLKKTIDFAADLASPLVIVVPSAVGKASPVGRSDTEEAWLANIERDWNYAVESVKEVSDYAEKARVYLAIEPINRYETYLVNTAEQAIKFVSEVDSEFVKIHLDCFHMNIEEKDIAESIRKTGPLLINLHVADSNRQAVGNGHIDFKAVMKALLDINYQGAIAMEPLPPVSNPFLMKRLQKFLPDRIRFYLFLISGAEYVRIIPT